MLVNTQNFYKNNKMCNYFNIILFLIQLGLYIHLVTFIPKYTKIWIYPPLSGYVLWVQFIGIRIRISMNCCGYANVCGCFLAFALP